MNSSEKANLWCLGRREKKKNTGTSPHFCKEFWLFASFFTGGDLFQWFPFQSLHCHCTHKSLQSHTEWWHLSYSEAFMVLIKVHSSRMMTVVAKIIGALPKKKKKKTPNRYSSHRAHAQVGNVNYNITKIFWKTQQMEFILHSVPEICGSMPYWQTYFQCFCYQPTDIHWCVVQHNE